MTACLEALIHTRVWGDDHFTYLFWSEDCDFHYHNIDEIAYWGISVYTGNLQRKNHKVVNIYI